MALIITTTTLGIGVSAGMHYLHSSKEYSDTKGKDPSLKKIAGARIYFNVAAE